MAYGLFNPDDEEQFQLQQPDISFKRSPEEIQSLLGQVQALRAPQVDLSPTPPVEQAAQQAVQQQPRDYQPEMEAIYEQYKQPLIPPEKQKLYNIATLLNQLGRPTAADQFHFQGQTYNTAGITPEQFENIAEKKNQALLAPAMLQKQQLLERYKALKDLQGVQAEKESKNILNQYRLAEIGKFKKDEELKEQKRLKEESLNNPNSDLSKIDQQRYAKVLADQAAMLEAEAGINPKTGVAKKAAYKILSKSFKAMISELPNLSSTDLEQLRKENKEQFDQASKITGQNINEQLGRANIYINSARAAETTRHNQATEDLAGDRLAQAKAKLQHSFNNAKLDKNVYTALNDMNKNYSTITGVDELVGLVNQNPTGMLKAVENALAKPAGQQSAEDKKLIAKLAFVYQPYRKEQYGVPSAGDELIVQQFFPQLKDNPDAFKAALNEFKFNANRDLTSKMQNFTGSYTSDLGISPDDITETNAYELFKPLKGKLHGVNANPAPSSPVQSPNNNAPAKSTKTISKKLYSPSRNKTKIIYSDGSEEVVDGKQ